MISRELVQKAIASLLLACALAACGRTPTPQIAPPEPLAIPPGTQVVSPQPLDSDTAEKIGFVTIEELYRDAPPNSTKHEDWQQWENEYVGMYLKEKGTFDSVSIHPQEGKLFFVVTTFGEGSAIKEQYDPSCSSSRRCPYHFLGRRGGSFLIDDTRWINLGESYAFEEKSPDSPCSITNCQRQAIVTLLSLE